MKITINKSIHVGFEPQKKKKKLRKKGLLFCAPVLLCFAFYLHP